MTQEEKDLLFYDALVAAGVDIGKVMMMPVKFTLTCLKKL